MGYNVSMKFNFTHAALILDLQHISQHHLVHVFLHLQFLLEEIDCIVLLHVPLCYISLQQIKISFAFIQILFFLYLAKMTNNIVDAVFVN